MKCSPLRPNWNKFHTRRCACNNGHVHASGVEARRCDFLHLLMRARPPQEIYGGRIVEIISQPTIALDVNGVHVCNYRGDFAIIVRTHAGVRKTIIEDSKGFTTDVFRIKRKLYDAINPGCPLQVVRLLRGRWIMA